MEILDNRFIGKNDYCGNLQVQEKKYTIIDDQKEGDKKIINKK
jgi:hypothetical protein